MKSLLISFQQLLFMVKKDKMLLLICFVPILCGFIFRYGVPIFNQMSIQYFKIDFHQYYSEVRNTNIDEFHFYMYIITNISYFIFAI
mgnify:CR=1 FL=1